MYEEVTWVVACTDDRKFRLMLRYLPEDPFDWLKEMVVVTHRERPDDLIRCRLVAQHWRPEWPITVRDDDHEQQVFRDTGLPRPAQLFFDHSLGIKLAIPLANPTPLLYTDDDVVVTKDPHYLFKDEVPTFSRSGLDGYTDTPKDLEGLAALNHAFDFDLTIARYNAIRTDEAVWYLPDFDHDDFIKRLERYFDTKHLQRISLDEGTAAHGHTQRFRKCGMRFWSGWVNYQGAEIMKSADYRALAQKQIPMRMPRATFIHYCASGQKERYMEWLLRKLES